MKVCTPLPFFPTCFCPGLVTRPGAVTALPFALYLMKSLVCESWEDLLPLTIPAPGSSIACMQVGKKIKESMDLG